MTTNTSAFIIAAAIAAAVLALLFWIDNLPEGDEAAPQTIEQSTR